MARDFATMRRDAARLLVVLWLSIHPSVVGQHSCFDSIGAINSFMQTELVRIEAGADPQTSYIFNLCSNTFFDASMVTLEPVLNNAMFLCGEDGSRRNRCVIVGGTEQVRIDNSLVPGYPLQEVTFMGITFSSFESGSAMSGTSVAAFASATTTANFMDCAWQDFNSDFVILQRATGSSFGPMTVQIEGGVVTSGTAGVVFDNDGGLLRVSEIDVSGLTAASLVATANNGASFLENSTVTGSDLGSVTYATSGGSQTVIATTVSVMSKMDDGFYVEMAGSTLLLEGVTVEQNLVQDTAWSVVSVGTGAVARVSATAIRNNAALEFGIVVSDATVSVSDSFIDQNTGVQSQGTTSAVVFAISDANVALERVEFNQNRDFAGVVVGLIRSTVRITRSCFQGGSAEFVVFIANDASFQVSENYVENFDSNTCEATGPRLFQEDAGAGCFLGASHCEGTCLVLADQDTCLTQVFPTPAPTMVAPTMPPVQQPTRSPNSMETIIPTSSPQSITTGTPTTLSPTLNPTPTPSSSPSGAPTSTGSPTISNQPSTSPTVSPMPTASSQPSSEPSDYPTLTPTTLGTVTKKKKTTETKASKGTKSKNETKPSKGTKSKSETKPSKGTKPKTASKPKSTTTSQGKGANGKSSKKTRKKRKKVTKGTGKGDSSKSSKSSGTGSSSSYHVSVDSTAKLTDDVDEKNNYYMDEEGEWVEEETDATGKDVKILEDEPPKRRLQTLKLFRSHR